MSSSINASSSAGPDRTSTQDARAALMQAVVRCVAEKGLAGAPLTVIHAAAGQKNMSATQYHFGSRDGLIAATLDSRMPPLDARRSALLADAIAAEGAVPSLRTVVSVWVQPLAEELCPQVQGNFYLRFLDHLRHEAGATFAERITALQPGYRAIFALIEQHLAELPAAVRRSRIALAAEHLISGLARLEADLGKLSAGRAHYPAAAVELLIDYIAGGLATPMSAASQRLVDTPSSIDFHLNFSAVTTRHAQDVASPPDGTS